MSELQNIEQALAKVVRRQRWQQGWRGFWMGLVSGAALWLLAVALYKLFPIPLAALYGSGLAAIFLAPLGFLIASLPSPTLLAAARLVDQKENLQERLSTAMECQHLKTGDEWRNLLIVDAAKHVGSINARRLLPWHLPKASQWALLVLALAAGLGFVPEYRTKTFIQKQREVELVKDTGRQLAELTRRSLAQNPPALPAVRQSMENASNLGDQMAKAKLTRNEALKDITSLTEKLKKDASQLPDSNALKRMEQAARTPQGKETSGTPAQKQMETLSKALQDKMEKAEAMDEFKKELEKAKEAAASGAASKDAQGDSKSKQELAKSLASMAQKAHDMGISMPDLDKAIQALAADQTDLMVKDLQAALKDLEKMKDLAQKFDQLQQQMEKSGKDLAEQLDKGQAKAAQETLAKMIKQLESAELPKDQLNKILDEVSKAIKPAGEYGKVADHLKEAVKRMQKGEKTEASGSLDAAAKELAKLMDEMGDLDSLKATLAALDKASMCLGEGNFGNKPGGKRGNKSGGKRGNGGFGDWTPEEGWMDYPEMSDLWENSTDNRGNLDPRSRTDRGDGQLADNLDPTKLRGKISPGSSMPSITIKGLSIKGTSKATVESSSVTAQDDAQNAISQEQIPRAYEGAVKDYFDDLKK
jgi:hypothetical protein